MCVLVCVECDWSDNDAQERLFRGIVTELKESGSQSLKSWINTFQNMIDNSLFYTFKWFKVIVSAVDGRSDQFSIQSHGKGSSGVCQSPLSCPCVILVMSLRP